MKRICVVTATRAEYGLLKPLMSKIKIERDFTLQVLATGAHLSPEFGLTYKHIEDDGFTIDSKIEMLLSADTDPGIVKSMGLGMIGYADAFTLLKPNAIIILGDRYEMLAVAAAASIFKIPIIHLHGGEKTEGAYDDAIRHAITKLSQLHFTSTEEYRNRVIQMGEDPSRVFNVGAIGLDNIINQQVLSKQELERELGVTFKKYNYQITFHPETLAEKSSKEQFEELLMAIKQQKDSLFIFTKANADSDGRIINFMIDEYVKNNPDHAIAFASLGSVKFLSLLKYCDAIVGNSSSGIIEAPSLGIQTINIGDRQKGRVQASSVVNCESSSSAIIQAFDQVKQYKKEDVPLTNPYGSGNTAEKIYCLLKEKLNQRLEAKAFYDKL
ncbi:UDP-N-acetylglucosamine 2-epimerase [Nubsella zeaxanthinifaciens]|uniref:UDP-N-acetylglucosamine 2-epimerase n=1 Tax=Nubsella zeaxanthinifaciens TaxID=392412 RepID=UPI003CFBDD97